MAQKTTKRPQVRRPPVKKSSNANLFYIGIAAVVIIGIVLIFVAKSINSGEEAAAAVNDPGASAQPEVESQDFGRQHVDPGADVPYTEDPPLSGPHDPTAAQPNVYTEPQRDENVVHALEHGDIAIYYNPDVPDLAGKLASFRSASDNSNDILIIPRAGLRADIVATAWAVAMDVTGFAGADLQEFVDRHHDQGPEGVVD